MKLYLKYIFFLLSFSAFGQEVEWLIEPTLGYDWIRNFENGVAVVEKNHKKGLINNNGRLIIPIIYDNLDISEGYIIAEKNDKWGVLNIDGEETIPFVYDDNFYFKNGIAIVKSNNKMGYINSNGVEIIPIIYDGAYEFVENIAGVMVNNKIGFINKSGKTVIPFNYSYNYLQNRCTFSEGLVAVKQDGKMGYIDKKGKIVIPFLYEAANRFSQGRATVKKDNKWAIIDMLGKNITDFEYDYVNDSYKEDLLPVKINDKWGVIDLMGKVVVDYKYDFIHEFEDGLARVVLNNDTRGYIDKAGKVVIPIIYQGYRNFYMDARRLSEGLVALKLNEKMGYMDKHGNLIIPFLFDYASDFKEGLASVIMSDGRNGVIKKPTFKEKTNHTNYTITNIFWKTDQHTTKNNTASIKSIISGNDIKPEQIKILVNGKSQNGQKLGETSLKANQGRYDWQGVVSLQEGENEIVLAVQQPNQAEVRSEPLIIRYEEPTKPNLYIVSVGVKGLGLKYTPNDAQKIADVFRTQKGKLFGQVNISTYNQEQNTTAESLRNGIGELSSIGITPNDVLVVFVSAHGEKISKRDGKTDFAVLTSNFNSTNIFTKENTSLLYESHIIEYLKPIDCKKLILLDACHSGQATEQNIGGAKTRYLQDLQEAQEVVKRTPSGIITIASTSGELLSYEDDLWQNGAFTKALVDGLNGKADVNGDRYIYVGELFKYIEKTVPTIVNQAKKQRQEPKIYPEIIGSDKDFPIMKY